MRVGDIQTLAALIFEKLESEGFLDNCLNCMYWNNEKDLCNKFKERPPARVIVNGCEFHDVIPF